MIRHIWERALGIDCRLLSDQDLSFSWRGKSFMDAHRWILSSCTRSCCAKRCCFLRRLSLPSFWPCPISWPGNGLLWVMCVCVGLISSCVCPPWSAWHSLLLPHCFLHSRHQIFEMRLWFLSETELELGCQGWCNICLHEGVWQILQILRWQLSARRRGTCSTELGATWLLARWKSVWFYGKFLGSIIHFI